MKRRFLAVVLLAAAALNAAAQRVSLEVSLSAIGGPQASAGASVVSPVPPGLGIGPLLPALLAPSLSAPSAALPIAAPGALAPRTALPVLSPALKARARSVEAPRSDESARAESDALFDARGRLHADDAASLFLTGYRFDDSAGRVLAPNTGAPLTNKEGRALQNSFLEARGRRTLLRLARETEPGGSTERKAALAGANRDAVPREVRLGGANERPKILRRLASLYRRWLERPASVDAGAGASGGVEASLGALVTESVVKRLSEDPEGARLLDELRDANGSLRLPTTRVVRLDPRFKAVYTPTGRQMIVSLDYLRPFLLARAPADERPEAERLLATEAGALEYLTRDPARVAALAEDVDALLFHELVHFRQDLARPLFTAAKKEEVPSLAALEYEYEAYFRQGQYIQSRLSRPGTPQTIQGIDNYLALISGFDEWRASVDSLHEANFSNGIVTLAELAKLQSRSQGLLSRLAGPESRRSLAAANRLEAAGRGSDALMVEQNTAETQLAEYRARWPALARDGLLRWQELLEAWGHLPQLAQTQSLLAKLAVTPEDASAWSKKADQTISRSLVRLESMDGLNLNERAGWITALSARFNGLGVFWPLELTRSALRDYAELARELRAGAETAPAAEKDGLLRRALEFEGSIEGNRASLREMTQLILAEARAKSYPARRKALIAAAKTRAELLGDEALLAEAAAIEARAPADDAADRAAAAKADGRPLRERMLERIQLDDRDRADEKKALDDALNEILLSPTGLRFAEEFLAEGATGVVRFEEFPDSQLLFTNGKTPFTGALAYTEWKSDDTIEVRLNRHYLDADAGFMRESLPSILGHELLGHGLWYSRAERAGVRWAFHFHEHNELLARIVGWAIDHERNGRFTTGGPLSFLNDAARYMAQLKMRMPYYAMSLSPAEIAEPVAALRARLVEAEKEVKRTKQVLAEQLEYTPKFESFSRNNTGPKRNIEKLRKEHEALLATYRDDAENAEAIVRDVKKFIAGLEGEPESVDLLRISASNPFFAALSAEIARQSAVIKKMAENTPPPGAASPRPADEVTWDELAAPRKKRGRWFW